MYIISIFVDGRHFCLCIDLLGGPPVCICCVQNNKSWDHLAPDKKPLFHVQCASTSGGQIILLTYDNITQTATLLQLCFATSRPGCGAFKCTDKVRQLLKDLILFDFLQLFCQTQFAAMFPLH